MREIQNQCFIEGKLSNITYTEINGEKPAIRGDVIIRVTEDISGKMVTSEVPVSYYINKFKRGSTERNIAYDKFLNFKDAAKTIYAVGNEALASTVSCTASLEANEYYSKRGTLVSTPRVRANFFNFSSNSNKSQAHFEVGVSISKMGEEHNKDGDTTGRYVIEGIIPGYNKATVLKFYIENPQAIDYVSSNYCPKGCVILTGKLKYSVEEVTGVKKNASFSDSSEFTRTFTSRISEAIMYTGSTEMLDEETALTEAEIVEGLTLRSKYLKDQQERKTLNAARVAQDVAPNPNDDF